MEPRPSQRAFPPSSSIPCPGAIGSSTGTLGERTVDEGDREHPVAEQAVAESFLAASDECRAERPPDER